MKDFSYDIRIRYFYNSKEMGQSFSRNRAVYNARGDYVCILDSDDIMLQNALNNYVTYMDEHKDVDVYSGCAIYSYDDGTEKLRRPWDVTKENILNFNPLCHQATVVKRHLYRQDIDLVRAADYELWLRLFYEGKKFVLDKVNFYAKRKDNREPPIGHMSDHYKAINKWKDKILNKR